MKLLFIGNGNGLVNVASGGAIRIMEILKRWQKFMPDLTIKAWTTAGGYNMFKANGLELDCKILKASIFAKAEMYRWQRLWSYIVATVHALIETIRMNNIYDVIYTGSDFFCDIIPAFFLKLKQSNITWICNIHHRYLKPDSRNGNYLLNLFGYLGQRLSFILIAKKADLVFVYDNEEGDAIRKLLTSKGSKDISIQNMYNGIDIETIQQIPAGKKEFDCCFIGGLRPSKGINDFVPIWRQVVKSIPDARLILIGYYDKIYGKDLFSQIQKAGLIDNITLTGYVTDMDKIRYLKSSKIFISPSYEEGWGIAICEALACGIPVIAYDLKVYHRTFGQFMTLLPIGDCLAFADAIIDKIGSYNELDKEDFSKKIARRYSWDSIAKKELDILQEKIISCKGTI